MRALWFPLIMFAAIVAASACGDDTAPTDTLELVDGDSEVTPDGDSDDPIEVDGSTETADSLDDTAEVGPDGGDTADTLDTSDTADTVDTADTPDTSDTSDTSDTPDTADTADGEVTTACDFEPGDPAFDDHTIARVPSAACFFTYAGAFPHDPVVLKYVIVDINRGGAADATVRFADNAFYRLHDEWYWFRLLNGQPIPHLPDPPVQGLSFDSIAAVYQAFAGQTTLPLDLEFLDSGTFAGRLYSPRFYALAALQEQLAARFFGLGSIVHFAPHPERTFPGEVWGVELEFSDAAPVAYLERVFAVLAARLPPEIASELRWIARSAPQENLVMQLRQSGHPLGLRALTYDDLVVAGAVEVYNEGIAAGRVRILAPDFGPNDLRDDEIAILPRVPDDIPPSRAIISAVPQTALAHVNLLAKSRGTPNAHVGGILSWGQLVQWDWNGQPVAVEVSAERGVRWQPLDPDDYAFYVGRLAPPLRHVPQVPDLASAPLTVSLSEGGIDAMAALVPLAGGKSAGFLSFLEVPAIETPDAPLGITIKPFVAHQAELLPLIREAVADSEFRADARLRFIVLEGEESFLADNADDPIALGFIEAVHARHTDDAIAEIIARGGVKRMITDKPLAYETLRDLRAALAARFGFLARTQGLRFRSSSTAEDVPGFNGAGLYVSNTGFLYPSELADPSDRVRTIEHAIKQTWASYWGFQAFEERRAGRIDHFEGNMGVTVHARFDDSKERANAVMTFWVSDYLSPPTRRLVVNVQKGALPVTNPGGTLELPEIDEVHVVGDGAPEIVRVQRSTVADVDEWLFSDDELLTLYAQADEHAARWLAAQGAERPGSERPRTIVLDYELKYVEAGWPAMASGEVRPARIIWRQARVLDQIVKIAEAVGDPWSGSALPLARYLPIDLRTAARSLVAERCDSPWADLRVYRVYTEAPLRELFPFSEEPFIYKVVIDFKEAPPGLDVSLSSWLVQWTNLAERSFSASGTRVVVNPGIADTLGIDGFELSPYDEGTFRVWRGDTEHTATCERDRRAPYQSPAEFLRGLMPP